MVAGLPVLGVHAWRRTRVLAGGERLADTLCSSVGRLALIPLAAAVVCLPWVVWSLAHHASWWGLDTCRDWWFAYLKERGIEQGFLDRSNWETFVDGTWKSFWACFGYWSVWLSPLDYDLILLATGAAFGILIVRHREIMSGFVGRSSAWFSLVGALLLGMSATFASHAVHSMTFGFSAQGRYLAPLAVPLLIAMAASGAHLLTTEKGRHVGTFLLMTLLLCIQIDSMDAVAGSNRVRQGTRKVKGRLLSNVADVPSFCRTVTTGTPDWDGRSQLIVRGRAEVLQSERLCTGPIPAARVGWLVTRQRNLLGPLEEGVVTVRAVGSIPGAKEAELTYRMVPGSLMEFHFDLRELACQFEGDLVTVEIRPPLGAEIAFRRFELLDQNKNRLPVGLTHNLRTPPAPVEEFYISRKP
jgi:hypothetical protein